MSYEVKMTVFKESGKYYTEGDISIPEDAVELLGPEGFEFLMTSDVSDYVKKNSDKWPVMTMNGFVAVVTKDEDSDNVGLVPFMFKGD